MVSRTPFGNAISYIQTLFFQLAILIVWPAMSGVAHPTKSDPDRNSPCASGELEFLSTISSSADTVAKSLTGAVRVDPLLEDQLFCLSDTGLQRSHALSPL